MYLSRPFLCFPFLVIIDSFFLLLVIVLSVNGCWFQLLRDDENEYFGSHD